MPASEKLDCRLIVFAKAPVPGEVKTRLVPFLGEVAAARLYEFMVLSSLATAIDSHLGPVELWCTPSLEHPFFKHCAENFRINLRLQSRGDIGNRMRKVFQETLTVANSVLLLGTDCPAVTQEDLIQAAAALRSNVDAVFIPVEDGGYCLIGLRHCQPGLFSRISWGTEKVMDQTRDRLRDLRWRWHEMPKCWDVDRPEDVERLKREGYLLKDEKVRG